MNIIRRLKVRAKKWRVAIIAYHICNNLKIRYEVKLRLFAKFSSPRPSKITLPENLHCEHNILRDSLEYAGLPHDAFRGKRILEIGPGDNLGMALILLASGAAQVVALDRFCSKRDVEHRTQIYLGWRQEMSADEQALLDAAISFRRGLQFNQEKLKYVYGHGVEEAVEVLGEASFDYIVSTAVLEEVYEIDNAFEAMDRLLVPGGMMMHKIDLRDYGMFTDGGLHPLTFLTISDFFYRRMIKDSGKPNRRLIGYYREKMAEMGYETTIYIKRVVGRKEELLPHKKQLEKGVDYTDQTLGLISSIRPKLVEQFRAMSDEDLIVAGIFLIAKKPSQRQ